MNPGGIRGRQLHEDLINVSRFTLLPYLWKNGFPCAASVASENIMRAMFGPKKIPDSVLMSNVPLDKAAKDNEMIIVEVGRFNPDKWGPEQAVVHVGFNGTVGLINGTGSTFEATVRHLLQTLVPSVLEGVAQ